MKWYEKAAAQGQLEAQFGLGCCYLDGQGVPKDESKAVEWCQKAASKGHASAQFLLGVMHYMGRGVLKDKVKAYVWVSLSSEQGVKEAGERLSLLKTEMTREQITEAQEQSLSYWKLISQGKPIPTQ